MRSEMTQQGDVLGDACADEIYFFFTSTPHLQIRIGSVDDAVESDRTIEMDVAGIGATKKGELGWIMRLIVQGTTTELRRITVEKQIQGSVG